MFIAYILTLCLIQGGDMIALPAPEYTNASIEECIEARRSIRSYKDKDLTLEALSTILWAAQGITNGGRGFRAVPSAGATYPLEVFVAKKDGLFRYIPQSHALKQEKNTDVRSEIAKKALSQMFIANAGAVIIITAIYDRTTWRYRTRGKRYVHMEVGHCAQNIHLEAVALGLGSVPIGAFDDNGLKKVLGLKQEEPLYIIPVGYSR